MVDRHATRDIHFFQDVTRITLEGLAGIAADFSTFYQELSSRFQPALENMAQRDLPEASDQLNAIVEATERATTRIMDILEEMQTHQDGLRILLARLKNPDLDAATGLELAAEADQRVETCQTQVMTIFEELSFQDLTGQRIKRIVGLVQAIEGKVKDILTTLGRKVPVEAGPEEPRPTGEEQAGVELKGPQRPGSGMDQTSVDDLINGLLG
jgi:chemotaxis protein CheZ